MRTRHHPVMTRPRRLIRIKQGGQAVAPALPQSHSAHNAGRHICTQGTADLAELFKRQSQSPQLVASNQSSGSVSGAAGHSSGYRNAFINVNTYTGSSLSPRTGRGQFLQCTSCPICQMGGGIKICHHSCCNFIYRAISTVCHRFNADTWGL